MKINAKTDGNGQFEVKIALDEGGYSATAAARNVVSDVVDFSILSDLDVIATYEEFLLVTQDLIATQALEPRALRVRELYKLEFAVRNTMMWGTPIKEWITFDSNMHRIVQHACANYESYVEFAEKGKYVLAVFEDIGLSRPRYISLNRNEYKSTAYAAYQGARLTYFAFFNALTQRMEWWNPFTDDITRPLDYIPSIFPKATNARKRKLKLYY